MHCRPFLEGRDLLISRPEIMFCNIAWNPLAERSRHNVWRTCSRTVEELVMPRYHHGRLLRWYACRVDSQASLKKNLRTEAVPFNTLTSNLFVLTFPVSLRPLPFTRRASSCSSHNNRTKQTLPPSLLIVWIVFFTKGSSVALSYTKVKIVFIPCLAASLNIDSRYFSMSFQYRLVPNSKTDLTKSIET